MVFSGIDQDSSSTVFVALDREGGLLWESDPSPIMSTSPAIIDDGGTIASAGYNDDIRYLTEDGNGMPTPVLADLGYTQGVFRADDRAIFLSTSQRIYSLEPPASLLVWYTPGEDMAGAGAYDASSQTIIYPSYDLEGNGRITGMSRSLVWFWDFEFDSNTTGDVLVDLHGDVAVSVSGHGDGATGVWCIGSDQVSKWFYDTGDNHPGSPIANGNGHLVLTVSHPETYEITLLAIGNPL
jgi:hypothetical protein